MPEKQTAEEENVITSEEFERIEKKEGKKKGGFFGRKKDERVKGQKEIKEPQKPPLEMIDELVLKIEKMEGKLEAMDGMRAATDERISKLTEEIGEVRSAIMERERAFNKMESAFEKFEDLKKELKPERIVQELMKREEEISQQQARVESLDLKLKEIDKGIKEMRDTFSRIKSFENLVFMLEDINKKVRLIDKDKTDTSRIAGKVESMFSELISKMKEFQAYREKIDFNEDMMHDIMKTVDGIEVKMEKFVLKDDMKGIFNKLDSLKTENEDKIQDIKDVMEKLIASLKQKGMGDLAGERKRMQDFFATKDDVQRLKANIDAALDKLQDHEKRMPVERSMKRAPPKMSIEEHVRRNIIEPMNRESPVSRLEQTIEEANYNIELGELEKAKRSYESALKIYSDLRMNITPEEANLLYQKVKRVYDNIRSRMAVAQRAY